MPTNDYFNFNEATIPTRGKAFSATLRSLFNEIEYGFWLIGRLVGITRGAVNVATTTGAANIYLADIESITEYVDFLRITLRIHATNESPGPSTLKINALTTLPILRQDGTELLAGDLLEDCMYDFSMDFLLSSFILMGRSSADAGDIVANSVTAKYYRHGVAFPVIEGSTLTIDAITGTSFVYDNTAGHHWEFANLPPIAEDPADQLGCIFEIVVKNADAFAIDMESMVVTSPSGYAVRTREIDDYTQIAGVTRIVGDVSDPGFLDLKLVRGSW